MQVTLRQATGDDADTLSDLAHRAKAHWGYPANWMREWDVQLTILPSYIEQHHVWVAEHAAAVVGMCVLEDRGPRWMLEHVWVEPSLHRHGIGRILVGQALETARQNHARIVELLADPYATGFYERLGARLTGHVRAPMPGARDRVLPRYEFDLS